MSYSAYITKIKNIKKHSNADRLNVGECFGNQVIVSLETEEGALGIYFPTDGQLGVEYCEANNLVRKKDADGNEVGGYLDPNKRHIRTIRLRKEISDGLFMPLKSLEKFTDISKLKEGDMITVLDGVEICRKYVPVRSNKPQHTGSSKQRSAKKEKAIKYPTFSEHIDTSQLMYNLHQFKPGDICYMTLKMHGCFTSRARVKIWGKNKAKLMKNIEVGDILVGMNEIGEYVPSKVINKFNNGESDQWMRLMVTRNNFAGEEYSSIICTKDHKFFKDSKYVEAKNLLEGDKINSLKQTIILTKNQKSILLGLSLGDGYYCKRNGNGMVQFSHKQEHEELVKHTLFSLGNIANNRKSYYKSGYGSDICRAATIETLSISKYLDSVRNLDLSKNRLKEKLIDEFDEISLAYLYIGDGSLSHSDFQQDRACIAICSYNDHDAHILVKAINKLNLYPVLYKDALNYNRLRFNLEESKKLFDKITKYIPDIVRYKVSEPFRCVELVDISSNGKLGYETLEQKIISTTGLKNKFTKYDLETETHNYVVSDLLVHNSSGRTMNSLKTEKKKNNVIKRFLGKGKTTTEKSWECVSGTRRVVLENYEGGYYGSNEFRLKYHNEFIDKLQKGETVYYEIVGYQSEGRPIMGTVSNKKTKDKAFIKKYGEETVYSYGCENGENDIYIYRMSITNEDGFEVDYPWDFVKTRAEQMGVKTVPELDRFVYTTQEDLLDRVNIHLEGEDPIGRTHIREGVVVRIEGKDRFKAFKHKGFYFKLLEGIIKDDGIVDEEEAQDMAA